jgi:hypothetical protein
MVRPTFPLRFSHEGLRELVRVVAEREGISQNELLEQAAEHEVVARGALLADELEALAAQLRATTGPLAAKRTQASIAAFIEGEALPDPTRPRRIIREPDRAAQRPSQIGAVAAFERG